MIVCHCALVSDRQLRAEVESGATSFEEIARRCGASQYCGGCTAAVERIVQMPARAVAAVG